MADPLQDFAGAKLMLFVGDRMVILRRDHAAGIPWPGCLDFPGGAREQDESPKACAARETLEEVGLRVSPTDMRLAHVHWKGSHCDWFFAAHLDHSMEHDIIFGGEGDGWCLMPPAEAATHPDMIPHFARILTNYLLNDAQEKTGSLMVTPSFAPGQ